MYASKLSIALSMSFVIMLSTVLPSTQSFASTANNTINQTESPDNQNLINSTEHQAILQQNSDGKLDALVPSFSNETTLTSNGTLKIQGANIEDVPYEQIGPLKVREGDILLASEIVGGKAAVDKFIISSPWTNGEIPVVINSDIPNKQRIFDAIRYVDSKAPIKFVNVDTDSNGNILNYNYLRFVNGGSGGCYTFPGMVSPNDALFTTTYRMDGKLFNGYYGDFKYHGQPVVIADWCQYGSVVHELGHVLGLWHEQTRCDRVQHIIIDENNIKKEQKSQYIALCDPRNPAESPTTLGFDYDYCSIMHYGRGGGNAIDQSKPIMIPRNNVIGCTDIGQREGFSPIDIMAIQRVYAFVQ
jgi:hypothetical protein